MKKAPDWKLENQPNFTIGDLKEILYSIGPECKDMLVFVERVYDVYFEEHNWTTLKIENDIFPEDKDEFIPSWCCTIDKEKNALLIHCHY